ncbi:MAG: GNAT family N-acetyltransferase [Phenylobacterium sp.]|uniref:GNAT family N-acetyltransferase n=1 Tax=Phenylobacterium sp. TaxID=1871053 RepID=UPI001A37A8AF|nr:GNAT family N-acetyltransferase [Phenylobacterium sp.]MBL8554157.1 GNAT family N-acetyltransferase [Phenylobacterium sp.]
MVELTEAAPADHPAVIAMTNRAFRAPAGQAAWKVETLVGGQRIDASLLADDLAQPGARLLIWREGGQHLGHVRLDAGADGVWHLAMLTVDPERQDGGLGRALLSAAEDFARARGARRMHMTVVHQRPELIAWYARRGYAATGETVPFPYGDARFGAPTQPGLYFDVLEKTL